MAHAKTLPEAAIARVGLAVLCGLALFVILQCVLQAALMALATTPLVRAAVKTAGQENSVMLRPAPRDAIWIMAGRFASMHLCFQCVVNASPEYLLLNRMQ